MRLKLTFLILLLHALSIFGQEHSFPALLESDSTWGKEIFEFPIRFAKEIDYKGYEEALFPDGWSNRDTLTFWSYAFVWYIDIDTLLSEKTLENDIQLYFDGLSDIEGRRKNGVYIPNTVALFLKKDAATFTGKVRTYDRFTTKKLFTLNTLVEQHYCEKKKKMVILFKFSPKDFGHKVWDLLNEVKVRDDVCDI